MFSRNEITEANRWCYLIILLTGWVVFSSCVSSTLNTTGSPSILNTTGSTSLSDNEAYAEIKAVVARLRWLWLNSCARIWKIKYRFRWRDSHQILL